MRGKGWIKVYRRVLHPLVCQQLAPLLVPAPLPVPVPLPVRQQGAQ